VPGTHIDIRAPIYRHLHPFAFDVYRIFALTYRHRYALSLLHGSGESERDLLRLTGHDPFLGGTADGPLSLSSESIDKQSDLVYGMMDVLYCTKGQELYSVFACEAFRNAVRVAWDFRVSGHRTLAVLEANQLKEQRLYYHSPCL
jgi:hypothetical protein